MKIKKEIVITIVMILTIFLNSDVGRKLTKYFFPGSMERQIATIVYIIICLILFLYISRKSSLK